MRESTRPLVSLWLDAVLLHLVASAEAGMVPVWIILDDAGSLERLTQLPAVATRARKANIRLVLGVRNRAQLVSCYGTVDADRILSQPLTKIFLRCSEPQTAKWISEAIGDAETKLANQLEDVEAQIKEAKQAANTRHQARKARIKKANRTSKRLGLERIDDPRGE